MEHTKEPWTLDSVYPDQDGYKIRGGTIGYDGERPNGLIAVVKNQGTRRIGEAAANARLIAAAPETKAQRDKLRVALILCQARLFQLGDLTHGEYEHADIALRATRGTA